jgi:hypothetical protein
MSEATVRAGDTLGPVADFGFSSAMKFSVNEGFGKERQTILHNSHRLDGCHPYMTNSHHGICAFVPF